jgi:hypothetical protein
MGKLVSRAAVSIVALAVTGAGCSSAKTAVGGADAGGHLESGTGGSGGNGGTHGGGRIDAGRDSEVVYHPEAGTTSTADHVSQYGVTWTFGSPRTVGQFANGDYWVIGPVTITSITPSTTTSGGRTMNGWDVNPLPSDSQGYDSCAGLYSASDVPALPYAAKPGSSIVQAVSLDPPGPGAVQPCLSTAAVLTVVDKAPPDNGATAFRPPYVGPKKVPVTYYSTNDVQWSLLPSLTPDASVTTFAPTIDSVVARLGRVQLDHMNGRQMNGSAYEYNGVPNAAINPTLDMGNYGPSIDLDNNDGILRLMLNDSMSAKVPLAIAMIQGGIDRYGMLLHGQFWPQGSGMYEGRKVSIAFAAMMLDDEAMKKSVTGKNVLGMTDFFLEDSIVGVGYQGAALYGSGLPNVNPCGDPYQTCTSPDFAYYWTWEKMTIGANDGSSDPYRFLDTSMNGMQGGDAYQGINSPAFLGSALIGALIPAFKTVWGHPEFFEYVDRWVDHGERALPDPCAPLSAGGGPDPKNPGGCILDPNLVAGSTMENFACQTGKTCGRWPQYDGASAFGGSGSYQSAFANAMWTAFRNASAASVYASRTGLGQGTITSSPPGISCGTSCAGSFPVGTVVKLTAKPIGGSKFGGWSGPCSGTGTCSITIKSVTSELPTTSVCPGLPPGVTCKSPPTGNVEVTASFD